jgi:hypothetical protein
MQVCHEKAASGYIDSGSLWKRDGVISLDLGKGTGTYGKELPEYTTHWEENFWNDGKKKSNNYSLE